MPTTGTVQGLSVALDDDMALPVSIASVRKRLSLSTRDFDDQLCEQVLEVTEQLEADVNSFFRPATVVQYFDSMFGMVHYPQTIYLTYLAYPHVRQTPFDLRLRRYPLALDVAPTVEYLDENDVWQSYTGFQVGANPIPARLRFEESLPAVKTDQLEAWRITYRSYYETVPRKAKSAIIQRVVDEFQNRGLDDRENDLVWQKAVRSLVWGPL